MIRSLCSLQPKSIQSPTAALRACAFLQNHREAIVAFGFFAVPTSTFRMLYCFVVIEA